jgi:hypothetical protein
MSLEINLSAYNYHEGVIERSEDVSNSEVLSTIGDFLVQSGHFLDSFLFFLHFSLSNLNQT